MVKTEPQPRRSRRNSSAGSSKDLSATKKESKSDNSGNGSSAAAATSSANSTIATITKGTKRTRSDSSASNKSNRSNNNATKRSSNGTSNGVKKERKDSSCENDGDASNGDGGREQQQSGGSGSEAINEKPDEVMKEMEVDSKAGIGNAQGTSSSDPIPILTSNTITSSSSSTSQHQPPPSTSTTSTTAKTHTTSPLSSHLHSSHLTLSSTLILDHFGPTVQTVFDCLALKGDLGFEDLRAVLRKVCGKVENGDRRRVVEEVMRKRPEFFLQSQAAADSEIHGYVVSKTSIKAALLVLINHGIVETTQLTPPTPNCPTACFTYGISLTRASRLSRYDRYVTHVRNSIGNTESLVLRQVLCRGMMRTEDCVSEVAEVLLEEKEKEEKESLGGEERRKEVKKFRKEVVEVIVELRGVHLLKEAPTTGERSGGGGSDMACVEKDEKEVVEIVGRGEVEEGSVWMVDVELVDDRLKGEKIGRYFWERTGLEHCEQVITAAMFFCAQRARGYTGEKGFHFENSHVVKTMSENQGLKPEGWEDEEDVKDGVKSVLKALSKHNAATIKECFSGSSQGGYKIRYQKVATIIRESCIQTYICDRWGENAARIFAILRENNSFLDSDHLSTVAMVPEKETREYLHTLYQNRLVTFHDIPVSKQHAYNQTIYLWKTDEKRLYAAIQDTLRRAYINMRDRRRVYVNSDKAEVFDRLIKKTMNAYKADKKDEHGREEKEAKDNLAIIDYAISCADDDMVMFDFNPFRNQLEEIFM